MHPTFHLRSVAALDAGFLRAHGIRAVIWDVDGTLMPRHGGAVAPELEPAFRRLLASPELRHVILSNADEPRFSELGSIFPAIPVVLAYASPAGTFRRRLLGGREWWGGDGATGGARALRKPNPASVEAALLELGCASPAEVVLIGDQYLTDVAPANLAGVRSIKVATVGPESFPPAVRLLQRVEQLLYRLLGSAGRGAAAGVRRPSREPS